MHKIKRSHLYLVIFIIVLVESTLLNRISIRGIQPDLLLIGVLFFGLFSDPQNALEAGLAGGILRDIFAGGFFGINTVLFGAAALAISLFNDKIYKEFFLTQAILTAIAGMILYIGYFFFKFVILNSGSEYLGSALTGTIIPSVLYTSVLSPLVFFILIQIFRVTGRGN